MAFFYTQLNVQHDELSDSVKQYIITFYDCY